MIGKKYFKDGFSHWDEKLINGVEVETNGFEGF